MRSLVGCSPIWDREKPCDSPLPHYRTYGSRIRQFGRLRRIGTSVPPPPACLLSSRQQRFPPRKAPGVARGMPDCSSSTNTSPLFSSSWRGTVQAFGICLGGSASLVLRLLALPCLNSLTGLTPPMPSADCSPVFRAARSAPSSFPEHRGDLLGEDTPLSRPRRRIYNMPPAADGGLCGSCASPRRCGCGVL
jgi:hypothetical protein